MATVYGNWWTLKLWYCENHIVVRLCVQTELVLNLLYYMIVNVHNLCSEWNMLSVVYKCIHQSTYIYTLHVACIYFGRCVRYNDRNMSNWVDMNKGILSWPWFTELYSCWLYISYEGKYAWIIMENMFNVNVINYLWIYLYRHVKG